MWIYHHLFIHLPVNGQLGGFQLLATWNCCEGHFCMFLMGLYSQVGLLGHRGTDIQVWGISQIVLRVIVLSSVPFPNFASLWTLKSPALERQALPPLHPDSLAAHPKARTRLCCLAWALPAAGPFVGCPKRRPERRGLERWGCRWWPGCTPNAPNSLPGSTSRSWPRTCPGSSRSPSHRGRSCSPARGTELKGARPRPHRGQEEGEKGMITPQSPEDHQEPSSGWALHSALQPKSLLTTSSGFQKL